MRGGGWGRILVGIGEYGLVEGRKGLFVLTLLTEYDSVGIKWDRV